MDDEYSDQITFVAGCAVESDYFYVAAYADQYSPREYIFSHLLSYIGRMEEEKWFYRDTLRNVVSVCVKKATATTGRRLCSLSKEGEVEIFSNKDGSIIAEKIESAGVRLGSRGYLTELREIGDELYACGANDQVYKRIESGIWMLLTAKPLQIRDPLAGGVGLLNSIDGNCGSDVYACGNNGRLFHYNGNGWAQIALLTAEHLHCVRCVSADEVWVCGKNGTLLTGNFNDGFVDVSSVDDNQLFWSLSKFHGKVYLATPGDELFAYDGTSITAVETGFASGLMTYLVDSVPDMLWSFSPKEIACFDGVSWTRVNHPSNPDPDLSDE